MDSFCCENMHISAVKQCMNRLKLQSHKINAFLMMGNEKEGLCRELAYLNLSDTQA